MQVTFNVEKFFNLREIRNERQVKPITLKFLIILQMMKKFIKSSLGNILIIL